MEISMSILAREPWQAARHAALRRLLRTQREAWRERRRSLREQPPWEAIAVADDEERATQQREVELDIALLEMQFAQLREIEAAVRRLETGGYGRCLDCAGPMPPSRLYARPFAARYRACQEAHEGARRTKSSPSGPSADPVRQSGSGGVR
jgi:RNA polymerase-binding transcription factor DksA